jgi:hypothetical protein
MPAAMSLIHNERIKLTAGWLNSLAGAAAAAGKIASLVAGFMAWRLRPSAKAYCWPVPVFGFSLLRCYILVQDMSCST